MLPDPAAEQLAVLRLSMIRALCTAGECGSLAILTFIPQPNESFGPVTFLSHVVEPGSICMIKRSQHSPGQCRPDSDLKSSRDQSAALAARRLSAG